MKLRYSSIVELEKKSKKSEIRRVAFHPNALLAFVVVDDEIVGAFSKPQKFHPFSRPIVMISYMDLILCMERLGYRHGLRDDPPPGGHWRGARRYLLSN